MELLRALGTLIESPSPRHARIAAALGLPSPPTPAEHARAVAQQRYPHASVYLGPEGMLGGEARDRIEGFRRALGLGGAERGRGHAAAGDHAATGHAAAGDHAGTGHAAAGHAAAGQAASDRAADHLASLLGLLAALDEWRRKEADAARKALLAEARTTLMWEHLASWTGPYLASFAGCGVAFYEAWASLVGEALARIEGEVALPDYLPAALRAAPPLVDPRREGGGAFVASLLAPARSGVILLRDDLLHLADETGLACRAGERRYVLGAFLGQDPGAALEWLAGHAERWSARVAATSPARIATWWSRRAAETARLLAELAREVQEVPSVVQDAPSTVQNAPITVRNTP